MPASSVITIGNFDGVHAGHAALIARAREVAAAGPAPQRVLALTFDPHPLSTLSPEETPPRLTTFARRAALLRGLGADRVVRLRPDARTLHLTPEAFVRRLAERYRPAAFVEGSDFRFGRDRAGDVFRLAALGAAMGFGVEVVPPVEVALTDQSVVAASSTLVRWLVAHSRVRDAAILLGRPYTLEGRVVRGDRRGRTIGFPTANLRSACLAPGDGVYAGRARLPSGESLPAAISVGTKPTFGQAERTVEAYVLTGSTGGTGSKRGRPGVTLPGLPEYGWALSLEFVGWVRDQVRFESVEALVDQMRRDRERVREVVAVDSREAVCP